MRRTIPLFLCCLALACAALSVSPRTSVEADALQSGGKLQWYKGNMHTHSHWSDGDDYLEMIGAWYRDHDYQFLVFTDHNILANKERWVVVEKTKGGKKAYDKLKAAYPEWIEERTNDDGALEVRLRRFDEVSERLNQPGKFLLIQGEEISDSFHRHPIHLNASNVKELVAPRHGTSIAETIQNNVDAVMNQRERTGQPMIIHLNHPNFGYAVTAEDLMRIQGEKFFEVYNGHPGVHNSGDETHASTERIWDIVLAQRLGRLDLPVMYGLATDDGHNYHNIPSRASEPGRGWVMVLAQELTAAALIESLENGHFYSSSGVVLESVRSDGKSLTVKAQSRGDETFTFEFLGTRKSTPLDGEPILDKDGQPLATTHRYSDKVGEVLKTSSGESATYEFDGDELYVRCRVTSSQKHPNPSEIGEHERAWTQPVIPE